MQNVKYRCDRGLLHYFNTMTRSSFPSIRHDIQGEFLFVATRHGTCYSSRRWGNLRDVITEHAYFTDFSKTRLCTLMKHAHAQIILHGD